jgi:hypothetical protein
MLMEYIFAESVDSCDKSVVLNGQGRVDVFFRNLRYRQSVTLVMKSIFSEITYQIPYSGTYFIILRNPEKLETLCQALLLAQIEYYLFS